MSRVRDRVALPVNVLTGQPFLGAGSGTSLVAATAVVADASVNTYGAWVQVTAALATDCGCLFIAPPSGSSAGVATGTILSIGIGAAASEVELFAVAIGSHSAAVANALCFFQVPVFIPKGTRVAMRLQSVVTVKSLSISVGYAPPMPGLPLPSAHPVTIGVNTATSRGANLSGTTNTWAEITAATTQPFSALICIPSASNAAIGTLSSTYEIGVGASGSEVTVGSFLTLTTTSEQLGWSGATPPYVRRYIPAGTRIAARYDSTGVAYRDLTIIGIPYV